MRDARWEGGREEKRRDAWSKKVRFQAGMTTGGLREARASPQCHSQCMRRRGPRVCERRGGDREEGAKLTEFFQNAAALRAATGVRMNLLIP